MTNESERELEILIEYFAQWLNVSFEEVYSRFTHNFHPDLELEAICYLFKAFKTALGGEGIKS